MKIKDVRALQAKIRLLVAEKDYEMAYAKEIELYRGVLLFFARQGYGLAEAALETGKIEFPRSTL